MEGKVAFQKLAALCAKGEHCQQEMLEKMRHWGVDEEEQAEVMARLVSERYVNDERFARAFVHDKLVYDQWGRRKIEQALWLKRIDKDIAATVLDEIDDEDYIAVLRPMLRQKRKSTTGRNDYERNLKLIKWAMGRGFTIDIIRQCMETDIDMDFEE